VPQKVLNRWHPSGWQHRILIFFGISRVAVPAYQE
jgi:hypothetical protein